MRCALTVRLNATGYRPVLAVSTALGGIFSEWYVPAQSRQPGATHAYCCRLIVCSLMGGGWCESTESCAGRAYDPNSCWLGSSNPACLSTQSPGSEEIETTFSDGCVNTCLNWCVCFFCRRHTRSDVQRNDGVSRYSILSGW